MESTVMEFQERRTGIERRSRVVRRSSEERRAAVEAARGAEKMKHNRPLEVVGSLVAAALGLYVYQATGLYSAADSAAVGLGLGALIASWFVLNFRVALHGR